jgi:MFS family permease
LFKDEYALDASLVTTLFLTQFASAAISSAFVGVLADKFGRKTSCCVYTAVFACSCLAAIVPITPVLFLSRVLGGLSISLLSGVFESWVVCDFRTRKLFVKGCDLYRTFGTMGVVNTVAAIVSAFAGDRLVWLTGTTKAPLILSVVLAWWALQLIWPGWVRRRDEPFIFCR